jgi:mannonate dehydratase
MLTDSYLKYLRQMGVESVEARAPSQMCTVPFMREVKERVESAGIELFEIMMLDRYVCNEIAIRGPEADREVARFAKFLQDLSEADIHNTTYSWHFSGQYKTGTTTSRDCTCRLFDLEDARKAPPVYDREYPAEELWDNYARFMSEILPVAESARVRLQLHPNDPPVDHGGIARLFSSTRAFLRAMEISDHSPYSGVLFCVGCWSEMAGEDGRGEDIPAAIRALGREHIFQVHFRNCDTNLPRFVEVFPDAGYTDMPAVMRTLRDVGFDGMVVPDHVPDCTGSEAGPKAAEAYILGYIRALMQATASEG